MVRHKFAFPKFMQFAKKYSRHLLIFISLSLITVGFQNCSNDVNFSQKASNSDILSILTPSGTLKINNGDIYTNNQTVTTHIEFENATSLFLTNDACPSTPIDTALFETLQLDKQWLLSDVDGTSSVNMILRGEKDNVSNCISAQIILDRKAPEVNFTSMPNKMVSVNTAVFNIQSLDEVSGVNALYCRLSGQKDFTVCTATLNIDALAEGNETLSAYAVDKAGNTSSTVEYSWLVDLTAPTVAIADPKPLALTTLNSVMIYFKGDDSTGSGIANYKCSLNNQDIPNCTSPVALKNLLDGAYKFEVKAYDNVGWVSLPAQTAFVVDTKPSGDFQIMGVTGGTDIKVDQYLTHLVVPVLNWAASDGAQTYSASILDETGTTVVCGPVKIVAPAVLSALNADCKLTDNTKYVAHMSSFRNGLETKAPDFKFLVDASAPLITIINIKTSDELKTAIVNFSVTDLGSGVQTALCYRVYANDIRLDDCTTVSSISYDKLTPGNYTFYIKATDMAGNSTQSTPVAFTIKNVVCDPFNPVTDGLCPKGLKANLYYASAADRVLGNTTLINTTYNTVGKLITNGVKSNTVIFLPNLDVKLRAFTDGFGTVDGKVINDDAGKKLDEWFALEMTSYMKLGDTDEEGYYQIIVASDDGSNFYTDINKTGTYQKYINNDGVHSNKIGCPAKGTEVYLTKTTRLPIKIEYYQGPRTQIAMSVLWRKVTAVNSNLSNSCGFSSSDQTAWFGSTPTTGKYNDLKAEGFVAPNVQNFISEE